MHAPLERPPDTRRSTDAEYDRFLREGHLDALTLFGFIPAQIVNSVWFLLPASLLNSEPGLIIGLCVTLIYFSYAPVGFFLGRKTVGPVLAGKFTWQVTALVVAAAYLVNMMMYFLAHTTVRLRNDIVLSPLLVLQFAYLCAFVPVTEELAFQGYLQTRLGRLGVLPAMLITTALFVCIHFSTRTYAKGIGDVVPLLRLYFPPLFVFALVRQYTGSLAAAVGVHVLDNATIFFNRRGDVAAMPLERGDIARTKGLCVALIVWGIVVI
jgi:membrane protease YdiL (CAAX protease family)